MECCLFQAEDGIRDLVRSRGLGDVYKRQGKWNRGKGKWNRGKGKCNRGKGKWNRGRGEMESSCLLYTSDAADERSSVDLGGRRIIKKKKDTAKRNGAVRHSKVSAEKNE